MQLQLESMCLSCLCMCLCVCVTEKKRERDRERKRRRQCLCVYAFLCVEKKRRVYLLHRAMMWLLSSWTNFLVTASSIICFTCAPKNRIYHYVWHPCRLYLSHHSTSHHHYHSQSNVHPDHRKIKYNITGNPKTELINLT